MTTLALRLAPSTARRVPRAAFQITCAAVGAALVLEHYGPEEDGAG